jgi:hypothetical protein
LYCEEGVFIEQFNQRYDNHWFVHKICNIATIKLGISLIYFPASFLQHMYSKVLTLLFFFLEIFIEVTKLQPPRTKSWTFPAYDTHHVNTMESDLSYLHYYLHFINASNFVAYMAKMEKVH